MHVVFCCGGTAGHVAPARAMAHLLKTKAGVSDIRFIARRGGEESRPIEQDGYPTTFIDVRGLERRISRRALAALTQTVRAYRRIKAQFRKDPPTLVIGTGGYVSFPVVLAAIRLGIPTLLHEANAKPGLAVRLLASRVEGVLVHMMSEDIRRMKGRFIEVGMPVSHRFAHLRRADARRLLSLRPTDRVLLSFGGSQGAAYLNEACIEYMKARTSEAPNLIHVHGCGRRYFEKLKEQEPALCTPNGRRRIVPFIEDMPLWLSAADIVVCRSGAATVAELCAVGRAAVLVPSSNVTDDHQYKNARVLADRSACVIHREGVDPPQQLFSAVDELLHDGARRRALERQIHSLHTPDTDERILAAVRPFLS